jgi:hypothetical protein
LWDIPSIADAQFAKMCTLAQMEQPQEQTRIASPVAAVEIAGAESAPARRDTFSVEAAAEPIHGDGFSRDEIKQATINSLQEQTGIAAPRVMAAAAE